MAKMERREVKFRELKQHCRDICMDIGDAIHGVEGEKWPVDYIVGITRGGLVPAVMISHYLDVPMYGLKVSLRDTNDCESNLWMAEDAFDGKNILIVDDINDSGATFNWILQDWQASCRPSDEKWNSVWNKNVKFATIFNNKASKFTKLVDFYSEELDKSKKDVWIEFPYEDWWQKGRIWMGK